jgi:alpha-tubulin suppressor-like RCC1 family protein
MVKTIFGILLCSVLFTASAADVISIWGGARGTIALKSDGTVWTWGANLPGGKLGIGDTVNSRMLIPMEVHGAGNVDYLHSVTAIMGGEVHNVALKSDGTVWTWGFNFQGGLGDGTTNDSALPIQAGLNCNPPLTNVTKLGGRTYWNLAVRTDGSMWAWGMGTSGQLGNGAATNCTSPVQVANSQPGGAVNSPKQVSCGYTYGVALLTNGTVWTWGTGIHGELGNGTTGSSFTPVQVTGLSNITAISSGWKHTLALRADGTVWGWGFNSHGELGDGTSSNQSNAVQTLNVSNIVAISGGDYNSIALRSDGTVWKWGVNDVGELGFGTNDNTLAGVVNDSMVHAFPAQVIQDTFGNPFTNVVLVANRDYHNIAAKADGSVWMWGANDQGQCGVGTTNDLYRPSPVLGMGARTPLPLMVQTNVLSGYADLKWSSATGQYFAIEYATNLANGFTGGPSNILATPPANTFTLPVINGSAYFRLRF